MNIFSTSLIFSHPKRIGALPHITVYKETSSSNSNFPMGDWKHPCSPFHATQPLYHLPKRTVQTRLGGGGGTYIPQESDRERERNRGKRTSRKMEAERRSTTTTTLGKEMLQENRTEEDVGKLFLAHKERNGT